jgi:hypothetical protein
MKFEKHVFCFHFLIFRVKLLEISDVMVNLMPPVLSKGK